MSYEITKEQVEKLVESELQMAIEQHGEFNSLHEAYAVTLEEFEEAESELEYVREYLEGIKGTIFRGNPTYPVIKENFIDRINIMRNDATKLACEAIQVAAMTAKMMRLINGNME